MASRNADMQAIFSQLSEKNKDIMIFLAEGVKRSQETGKELSNSSDQSK